MTRPENSAGIRQVKRRKMLFNIIYIYNMYVVHIYVCI